jgi:hypothetical protein
VATAAPATDPAALLDADIGDVSGVTIGAHAFDAYAEVYRDVPGATPTAGSTCGCSASAGSAPARSC